MSIADRITRAKSDLNEVYNAGIEQGKQDEKDAFWNSYQNYGNRTNYDYAFCVKGNSDINIIWNENNFNPIYNMQPTSAMYMFAGMGNFDLVDKFKKSNITVDFSNCSSLAYCFANSQLTHIGYVPFKIYTLNNVFDGCTHLHTIDEIAFRNNTSTVMSNAFRNCTSLANLKASGTIPISISFQYSPLLTLESLQSIINALKDYSETGSTYTLTLHTDAKAKLTEADIAIITQKGWTLA